MPDAPERIVGYFHGEGMLLRKLDPDLAMLEIYRGNGVWDPYLEIQAFATNADRISDETAAKLIARHDAMRRDF